MVVTSTIATSWLSKEMAYGRDADRRRHRDPRHHDRRPGRGRLGDGFDRDGRERWLEPDGDRRLVVEDTEPPSRITWWWWNESDDEPARYVDVRIVAVPDGGTRVSVTETQPAIMPVARLAASFELVCA